MRARRILQRIGLADVHADHGARDQVEQFLRCPLSAARVAM